MKKVLQQIVVMADGGVRLPISNSEVAHGHMPVLQTVHVALPPKKMWSVLQLEIQLPDDASPDLGSLLAG